MQSACAHRIDLRSMLILFFHPYLGLVIRFFHGFRLKFYLYMHFLVSMYFYAFFFSVACFLPRTQQNMPRYYEISFQVFPVYAVAKVMKATLKYCDSVMDSFRNPIRNPCSCFCCCCLHEYTSISEFECYSFFQISAFIQCDTYLLTYSWS
jgi:hypothetical protein